MTSKPSISIQWHITTDCNNNCMHCYMYDNKTFTEEKENTLSDSGLLKVLDSILEFEKKWGCTVNDISITGGDPLLRNNWFGFLSAIKANNKVPTLMGNPESLTSDNLKLLQELGLKKFQLSLDGLEATHDKFRSEGSFKRTIEKIKDLEAHGISSQIMFTLYPENKNELIPLIKYLAANTPLANFGFDIGTTAGNANTLGKDFDSSEIKEILEKYLLEKMVLKNNDMNLILGEKSHLFSLLHYDQYLELNNNNTFPVIGGCLAGWYSIAILSDGSVLSCRRMPVKIGKMPEQSFEEIFLGSELLKKLRRRSSFDECGNCPLYHCCRGCPAYVFGVKGDPFALHPLCFKESVFKTELANDRQSEPGVNTTFEEEFQFFNSAFHFDHQYLMENLLNQKEFRLLFLKLADNQNELAEFLNSKTTYKFKNNKSLSEYDLAVLQFYFRKIMESGIFIKKEKTEQFMKFVNKLKISHLSR